jgi:hypothetical protein
MMVAASTPTSATLAVVVDGRGGGVDMVRVRCEVVWVC